jgi:hypothetical protein
MTSQTSAIDQQRARPVRSSRSPALLLLVAGLSLIAAGVFIWWDQGDAVLIENAVLAALAWCF